MPQRDSVCPKTDPVRQRDLDPSQLTQKSSSLSDALNNSLHFVPISFSSVFVLQVEEQDV